MIIEQSQHIIDEVSKVFIGKDEIIKKVLMTIYAGGHILLNDAPGTGKTTLALAFSKALGLDYKRIQFTTDTLPSDITGFTMFNRQTNEFEYREGAANCQLLLADEINRTSPKTQRFWRLWKKIPSVSMVRHMCCHCRLSVSQHRTRWDSPEHSRCRSHS